MANGSDDLMGGRGPAHGEAEAQAADEPPGDGEDAAGAALWVHAGGAGEGEYRSAALSQCPDLGSAPSDEWPSEAGRTALVNGPSAGWLPLGSEA